MKWRIIYVLSALILITCCVLIFNNFKTDEKLPIGGDAAHANLELSLKEATKLGLDRAKEWKSDAQLASITSVDENMGGSRGKTGKRLLWNLQFRTSNDSFLYIGISSGKITDYREFTGPSGQETIDLSEIVFDSPKLLKIAASKYRLQPGIDWATGYHYVLEVVEGTPKLSIIGNDKENLFSKINFNPRNGEVIEAIHKKAAGGEFIKYNLKSKESVVSHRRMAVKGVSANNELIAIWGDSNPREFNSAVHPFIKFSEDGGKSWNETSFGKNVVNGWLTKNNELFVVTNNEVFNLKKSKKDPIIQLETPIDSVDYTNDGRIALISNNKLYTTGDFGVSWETTALPDSKRAFVQINRQGDIVLFNEDRKIMLKKEMSWEQIETPEGKPEQVVLVENNLFVAVNNELQVYHLKQKKWDNILTNEPLNILKNNNQIFAYSLSTGTIYLLINGGDLNGWMLSKIYELKEGILKDLTMVQNEVIIGSESSYEWEPLNEE